MQDAFAASQVSSLSASATCSGITFSWSGSMDYFCYQIKSKANVLSSCLQNSSSKSYFVSTNDLISLYGYYPTQAISWQVIGTDNGDEDNPVTSKTSSSLFYDVPWKNMSTPTQDFVTANSSQKIGWTVDTSPNDLDKGGGTASIDGYVLELSSDGGTSYSNLATVGGISTNMWFRTIPGTTFAYNTAYKVRVTPKNSCGQGRWFSPVLSWTSVGLPPQIAPTGLTNTLNDGTSLSWTWNAIPDTNNATGGFPITGYKLQWASLNGSCWSGSWCTVVDNLNALTYTQTNQADNEIYNFRVFGINSKGDSTFYSDNVTVATPMVPPYIAPPTVGWQNCSHVRVVWTEPNFYNRGRLPVTNYNLYYKLSSKNANTYAILTSAPYLNLYLDVSYTALSMPSNTLYDFQVNVQNAKGTSELINTTRLTILTPKAPATMAAPQIATTDITPTQIKITWTALTTATETGNCSISGYYLEYCVSGYSNWTALTTTSYSSTNFLQTGFVKNTNYQYRVTAYNLFGNSPAASPVGTALTDTNPGTANTPVCTAANINPTNITLTWAELTFGTATGRDTITYYKLEWYDQYSTGTWVTVNTVMNVTLTAMHLMPFYSGLFPSGSTQQYRLSAMNGYGFGAVSASVSCVCDTPPTSMGSIVLGDVNPKNITITWPELTNSSNGGDLPYYYHLQYWYNPGGYWTDLTTEGVTGKILTFTHVVATPFDQTVQQRYQVRPKNLVGWGSVYSPTLYVTTDKVPQLMSAVTVTTINPKDITISWPALSSLAQHGGDVPYYYQVEWLNPTTGLYIVLSAEVMGTYLTYTYTSATVFTSNSLQYFRVTPKNGVGWGIASTTVSCTADREPIAMNTPTVVSIQPLAISIQWVDLTEPDNGRDTVTFYLIEWDSGTSQTVWTALNTEANGKVTSFTHTRATPFTSNAQFNYRVRPKNGVGWGPYSAALTVTADREPTFMNAPVITSPNINSKWIYITWTSLSTDAEKGRDEPTYYGLEWNQGSIINTWVNLTTEASGITNAFNHTNALAFPSNLVIKYRTFAKNGVGFGAYSTEVQISADGVPLRLNTPIQGSVTYNSIALSWTAITADADTGGDPMVYYRVEYYLRPCFLEDSYDCSQEAADSGVWTEISTEAVQGTQTSFTHTIATHFHSNSIYRYRICGKNGVGLGACSTEVQITSDGVPLRLNTPTNGTVTYNSIALSWTEITADADTGGDPIVYYRVEYYLRPCFLEDSYDCSVEAADSGVWTELSTEAVQGTQTSFTHTIATHFHANSDFRYRICGKNGVGLGACSSELVVTTDDVPAQMSAPLNVTILYNQVDIKWSVVTDLAAQGRGTITLYRIQWDNYASDPMIPWVTLGTVAQDEAESFLFFSHTVNPHFDSGITVNYRIQAENSVGAGPWSNPLTLITDSVPDAMISPIIGASNITSTQITIYWEDQALANNGRDPVIYYSLEWDAGVSTLTDADPWTELNQEAGGIVNAYTLDCNSTNFPNNTDYRFRLKSKNGVGFGAYSIPTVITSDRTPLQPISPTNGTVTPTSIEVSWTALTAFEDTGRDTILNYLLEYYDGSDWSTVIEVDANTFTHTHVIAEGFPANTDRSDFFVKYRVSAKNGIGYGILSPELSVLTDTYPQQMTEVVLSEVITPLHIYVTWTLLGSTPAETGDDPIIKHHLYWQEEGTTEWVELFEGGPTSADYNITSIPKLNMNYYICIAAENGVGIGPYSPPLTVLTDNVPTRMNTPEEDSTTDANFIKVNWAEITDEVDTGRDPVLYYQLEWDKGEDTWEVLTTPNTSVTTYELNHDDDNVQNGTAYHFRVTPLNRAGFGAVSQTLEVIPSSPPDKMSSITTSPQYSVSVISVKISVTMPEDNGSPVNSYIVKIKQKNTSNYFTELVSCDGSAPSFVTSRECLIPHATLRAAPFNLVKGDAIIGIANAANIKGYNASYSNPNSASAYVEDIPDKMGSVTRNNGQSWSTQFTVYFTAQNQYTTPAGGQTCQILSYHVQRDQGNNTNNATADVWTDLKGLASNDTATSVTATSGIVGGTYYKVRVRSLNKHGWGAWSNVVNIRAAMAPNAPPSASTTNSSLWIVVSWTEPFNNGLNITQYKVEILRKVGTWSANSECDGTTNQTIIANRQCFISMTTLRSTTYGYGYNEVPTFRVQAFNAEGWGQTKSTSGGAAIQTEPAQPTVVMTNNVAATNDLQVQVYWTAITGIANWKGYEVHAYEVWWQDKDGTFSYELLYNDTKPFQLTYTHKNMGTTPDVGDTPYPTQAIVGGTRYKFKYRAVNIHGPGPYSTEVLFYASTIPDRLDSASTSLLNSTVTISWTPTPNDHKQTVTAYRVKIRNKAGNFVEDAAICNGVKAAVVSSLKCSAAMLLFTTNLNLAIDDLIVVQVEAMNVMGYSPPSFSNTEGITAKKLPQTAPSSLSRGVNTGKTVVHLNWVGITANVDTGGQDVDYKVYFDKSTGGTSWYTLTDTTTNLTTYTDSSSFGVGKAYQFKVAAFNDFGIGPQSTPFTVWAAIAPSGLSDPTTTLNLLTYVEEDDIILIDWLPPTDDGGLAVSYKIEVLNSLGVWLEVDQPNECSEKGTITNYFLPQATTANAATQCSMLVSRLKFRWGLTIGDTVLARITAFQVVGSVTTTLTGAGTATLPDPPCFRTTFPRIIGGTNSQTSILAIDVDSLGNIVAGGYSQDSGLLGKGAAVTLPIAHYIAKGNYYAWGKYIETTDGITGTLFNQVLDITFRYDGQKIALVLDRANYAAAYTIVVLNEDGSLYGAFKEGGNQRGKVNITGTLFDNSNFITLAVDASQDGTDQKKYAQIVRFSVANPSATTITPGFYIQGGAINRISQSVALLRIKSEPTSIFASALIQDTTQNRRAILAKITLSNGAVTRYFHYTTQTVTADYNTDTTMAVIRRMSLYEDDISSLQIVSACIITQDGYKVHFGQFIFSTNQLFTVLTSSVVNRWYCLGMFQRTANIAFTLFNDRSPDSPSSYTLYYGKIDYVNRKIDAIPVTNHDGPNTYYGAYFVHSARFYYWGDTNKVQTSSTFNYAQLVGFLNIYDQQETLSCTSGSQIYNFASAPVSISLETIVSANMNWVTTGYTSGPNFAAQTGKNFKPFALTGGIFVLNLKEPISNNTFCPIVTNPTPATVQGPVIPKTMLNYDPDASSYPNQEVSFTPFTVSKTCPDQVNYYSTFIADDSSPLPAFMLFDPTNTKYIFSINNPSHVGTYNMILQATIGNNKTTEVVFTVQVASPCLGLTINVPILADIPTYDISDLVPTYIDLDWEVVAPPTPSCGEINFVFKMFNNTAGGVVDTNIFSIVNTTNGLQKIKIWTQSIPAAKTWVDLKLEARLQGDIVKNHVFTIIITNKCALTQIEPVAVEDQIYYTGRDPIDFNFVWPETVGVCGPITYSANEYLIGTPSSNSSLDSGVFAYPKPSGGNETLRIYTWDDSKVGIYQVRVWASLGVGGFQQANTIFNVQIIKDPCSYFPYVTSFVEDLTLWINQTDQVALIPPYVINDTIWSCNFTYELRTGTGTALDTIFVLRETVFEGDGPNITLVTTDKTKVDLSPQTVRVRGWPKRQNTTSQQFTFRIFVAYLDKSDCPSGQYYNTDNEICQNCDSPCVTCKGSATACTWCISGYTFIDSTSSCVQTTALTECPLGTIKDAYMGFCRTCPDFCTACTSVDNCTACVRNYYLATTNNVNYGCFSPKSCPLGYRMDDAQGCLPCSSNCASCPSSTVCNLCKDTYYLDTLTSECTQTCPPGYYGDASSKVCMLCSPACKTCVTNNYTCTSCNDIVGVKYYLFESTCVTRCPYIGFFQNEPARSCDACKSACKICVNAIDDCIVCSPGSVISGRECLNSCPEGFYITEIGTCFQCDPACSRCQGSQNSMCSECVPGQYLTQTTCESKCNNPLFPDNPTKSCLSCPYYCNQCTNANNCMKCKTGYQQLPQDCLGEMFLRLNTTMSLTVPINTALVSETFDPTSAAFEIWFKADNIFSMYQEIILGLSPYKMRKKNGVAQVQLNFGDNNYCDSKNLKSNQWYHFAVSMTEENGGALNCYIDGETIAVGQIPVATIATNIQKFKEISFGTSVDIKTSESRFTGYLKEFRWWKKTRSQFQFTQFKYTAITTLGDFNPPNELLAYWKFDEKRQQTSFIDTASRGSLSYDPTPSGFKLADLMEMREIYLKMCPEGTFIYFNETLGYYNCTACHEDCGNCNGETSTSCTSCISPYKLLETEQKCIITADCPSGYYQDANKNCWPCHPYCTDCYGGDQYQCTACQKGYFKAYKRAGCVDSCPRGLYGNYLTQSCSANPLVTSLYPEDGVVIQYGEFIDLFATYSILNEEPRSTYSYGWIITKQSDSVDIAKDATKSYAGEDILRVHLDNNIIEPNKYYNITFYVKGNDTYYNGMGGTMFNVIYIGIPPKGGVCIIAPFSGVATATEFTIQSGNWKDPDGIQEYRFLYSLDEGANFLPIPQSSYTESKIKYIFDPIYKTVNSQIKCQVKSLKGFTSFATTTFLLAKKSSSSSKSELGKLSMVNVTTEPETLKIAKQLSNILQDLGSLSTPPATLFDPKITPDQCTEEMCGFSGRCVYQTVTKQYYCECYGIKAGRNCTFKNATELEIMRQLALDNTKVFVQKTSGQYNREYLEMLTSNMDLMSYDLFDNVYNLVYDRILDLQGTAKTSNDLTAAQDTMKVISNLMEFLDYDMLTNNVTGTWNKSTPEEYEQQLNRTWDNLNRTLRMVQIVQNATLYKLSFLQTQIQMTSRKLSYKQVLTTKDKILSMPATDNVKKQQSTFVKISPANFQNTTVSLNDEYIAEAIEYSINPFQMGNNDRLATNIIEINLYNQVKTVTTNDITKVEVSNLTIPIEFSFPAFDNQNLTEFLKEYNTLNPFRNVEKLKREKMIIASGLTCVYWDIPTQTWSDNGCILSNIDTTHIKCACKHLSAFAILFQTPKMSADAPLLENSTSKADAGATKDLTLDDIVKWPIDSYFENLGELWQHNRPSFLTFILKPGFIVLGLFWAMYLSSLIYYSGRDDIKRYQMTKAQNREDLAELKDNDVQNLSKVIRDLIVRDFLDENGKYIARESRRIKAPQLHKKQIQPPQIKIYEQLSKEEKKKYKKRARRKVFGMPAGLCARADRVYQITMKHNKSNPNAKMSFFNEELKNNYWIGLIAKTSKIAPRHVRLAMMYLYASLYIILLTLIFAFRLQEYISDQALFQVVVLSLALLIAVWVITIPFLNMQQIHNYYPRCFDFQNAA